MENRDPIYLVNLIGHIPIGKSKKFHVIEIKGIVAKGTIEQIKKCSIVKRRFLLKHLGSNKKVSNFKLYRLKIVNVEIIQSLGYGIKRE